MIGPLRLAYTVFVVATGVTSGLYLRSGVEDLILGESRSQLENKDQETEDEDEDEDEED